VLYRSLFSTPVPLLGKERLGEVKELKELYLLAHQGCRIDAAMYNQDDSEAIAEAVNA